MSFDFKLILFEIFAYLCGSIPFGLIISKLTSNIDIREYGSHNIGSTNVARVLGKKMGALVLLLDGGKALFAVLLAKYLYNNSQTVLAITTFVVVIGHIFSVWLKFKGGKLFVLDYKLGLLFLLTWIAMFLLFKISALSALTAMIITTIASGFISKEYLIMMILLSCLTFYKHKSNIQRMLNGEELKFKKK